MQLHELEFKFDHCNVLCEDGYIIQIFKTKDALTYDVMLYTPRHQLLSHWPKLDMVAAQCVLHALAGTR
ncbi:MAG: hypothetical protein ACXVCT_03525 [Ktedonobacterales bacterium]